MVYVLNVNGQPLMPTVRHGKVRRMLKQGLAKVVHRCPFTIQLLVEPKTTEVQPIDVGDDAGSKHNGLSAVVVYPNGLEKEVYVSEVLLRNDIVKLLSTRREFRRNRRYRKTKYRQPRFNNRVHSKHKGWLAPSIENKIWTHIKELRFICSILPVSKVTIETASFDTQRLKADIAGLERPEGTDYQQGEQMGFWNVREYILFRDGHKCLNCEGKSGDKVLELHHMETRKIAGNSPSVLATLCRTCHQGHHKGTVKLKENLLKRGASLRDAAFMGIMRWAFYSRIKEELQPKGIEVHMTYGYITKNTRIQHGLKKTHCVDARVISGHPDALPLDHYYLKKKVRCHNRQIHKAKILKGGIRKLNQSQYLMNGYRLFDSVLYDKKPYIVFGRRTSGFFDVRNLAGEKVNKGSISYKKLKFLQTNHSYLLTEFRKQANISV